MRADSRMRADSPQHARGCVSGWVHCSPPAVNDGPFKWMGMQVLTPLQHAKMEIAAWPFKANIVAMCDVLMDEVCRHRGGCEACLWPNESQSDRRSRTQWQAHFVHDKQRGPPPLFCQVQNSRARGGGAASLRMALDTPVGASPIIMREQRF